MLAVWGYLIYERLTVVWINKVLLNNKRLGRGRRKIFLLCLYILFIKEDLKKNSQIQPQYKQLFV